MNIKSHIKNHTKFLSIKAMALIFLGLGSFSFSIQAMASETKKSNHLPFSFAEVDRMELNFQNELAGEIIKAKQLNRTKGEARKISGTTTIDSSEESLVEQFIELSRINVLIGVFAAFDLEIVEFKIQPYVELRFDKP
jgi:hypothetical protein